MQQMIVAMGPVAFLLWYLCCSDAIDRLSRGESSSSRCQTSTLAPFFLEEGFVRLVC